MSEKSVFVPTGIERIPEVDEWFWCPMHNVVEQQSFHNRWSRATEIYEEVKVRVDDM